MNQPRPEAERWLAQAVDESFQRGDLESALEMAERVIAEALRIVRTGP